MRASNDLEFYLNERQQLDEDVRLHRSYTLRPIPTKRVLRRLLIVGAVTAAFAAGAALYHYQKQETLGVEFLPGEYATVVYQK